MSRVAWALLALSLVFLTGCSGEDGGLRPAKVDVGAKDVRALKAQAGVEPCRPGNATDPAGGSLPAISLPCLGGGKDVDLSTLRGPMVISLWASWCGPCRSEMPILQRFHEKYDDRVPLLGIDYQDVQPYAAMQLVRDTGVTYPLLADPQASLSGAAPLPVVRGLPVVVLVDDDGRVVHTEAVAITSLAQLEDLVRTNLGVDL
jgi:thiol-disulfide isomerase/thioredoxin